ncbi:MAG TPA: radical SAM protein, partial [Terriglobales bacterium]|nr:radical SAM protein [Terriglobales bacterium]
LYDDELNVNPEMLTLMRELAAVLERAGAAVEMVDLSGVSNFADAMAAHCRTSEATAFGLTATTPQMPAAMRLAEIIRGARPDARLILGGPHATLVHAAARLEARRGRQGRGLAAEARLLAGFDVIVAGDGERAIFAALEPDAPALIDADDPKSPLFLASAELADFPPPARHLMDVDSYRYTIDGQRALSLIAQLGCPFGCGFCGGRLSPFLRRVRTRPAAAVVEEILQLREQYGVRGFMLYDDELNVNPEVLSLMRELAAVQQERGERFHMRGFIKSQLFTAEQAEAMRAAGFRWILVGFESGDERILENIQKRATREQNTRCVEIAHAHGLKVKALMSAGHPGESRATLDATRDWLLAARPDDFDLTVITTYPGTPYFDEAELTAPGVWTYTAAGGDRLHSREVDFPRVAEYYKGAPGAYTAFVHTDFLSAPELAAARDRIEREVRERLGIAYPQGTAAQAYEHSMGQQLPARILRRSGSASGQHA